MNLVWTDLDRTGLRQARVRIDGSHGASLRAWRVYPWTDRAWRTRPPDTPAGLAWPFALALMLGGASADTESGDRLSNAWAARLLFPKGRRGTYALTHGTAESLRQEPKPLQLNRSTRDSYTRCHGNTDNARLRVLPVCQSCVA